MSKLRKILNEINKQLEAAAMAEMRIDIARDTLINGESKRNRYNFAKKIAGLREFSLDDASLTLSMMADKNLYSNS